MSYALLQLIASAWAFIFFNAATWPFMVGEVDGSMSEESPSVPVFSVTVLEETSVFVEEESVAAESVGAEESLGGEESLGAEESQAAGLPRHCGSPASSVGGSAFLGGFLVQASQ